MRIRERASVRWLGLAASLMLVAVACARSNDDGATSTADRDPDSDRTSSSSSRPSTTAQRADTPTSATAANGGSVDTTAPQTGDDTETTTGGSSHVDAVETDATSVASITELIASGDTLVGRAVELRAKAFFLEECPPPDATAGGPCSLLLFVGDADRNGLLYGERDLAVPGYLDGVRVTCEVGPDTRAACADWEQGALYEIVGTVRQPEFGRGVELDISKRSPDVTVG